jgi:choline dehydrogenase-like flavoprotein
MALDGHADVIIIGTGAGGGTLAHKLAPSGKRILLLERGDWLQREKDNWESRAVFIEAKYRASETWYDGGGHPFHPGIHYYVGGNTKMYGAALAPAAQRGLRGNTSPRRRFPGLAARLRGFRAVLR